MTPEFERAQQDPTYLAWLDAMEAELGRFLTEDAPQVGALNDPYSADGLALCEQAIRDRFGRGEAIDNPYNSWLVDRFTRYIGEVHIRATESRWVNTAHAYGDGTGSCPQVLQPFSEWAFDPREQVGSAFLKDPQPPCELVWVLNNMIEEYTRWVDFGRPSIEEYERLYIEQIVAEADGNDL